MEQISVVALRPGDTISNRSLGHVLVERVHHLPTGDIEVSYRRHDRTGYGIITCTDAAKFELIQAHIDCSTCDDGGCGDCH